MNHSKFTQSWQEYIATVHQLLHTTIASEYTQKNIPIDQAFHSLEKQSILCKAHDGEIIFIGNGASATMASHLAADVFKNAQIRTRVLTDNALMTAMGNDISYEEVYAEPLRLLLRNKDILVAISSSGASQNILQAAKVAREKNCFLVTFSAFSENNPLRKMGHINFYVCAKTFGFAESCHATLLHHWMDKISLEN